MSETPKVIAARIEVARRRAALVEVARLLQLRLEPRTLASEAWEKAKNRGADLAEDAVDAVKSRPVAVGGVAAAIAMFLAREPIKDAAVKIYDAMTSSDATKKPRPALKPPKQPAPPPGPTPARPAKRRTTKTEKAT
ncbi:MAG: hypothetical protein M3Q83_04080 [Pseudomonadota bacterium]|nr:hypothetical protein [Pseudomonadota bacterium]